MSKTTLLATVLVFAVGPVGIGAPKTAIADNHGVTVTVVGESWDSDSSGFAFYGGLSKKEAAITSARRGSRITVDGQPESFAIAGPGPGFELTFTTEKPTFRLIIDGDRFPRTITQPYEVPNGGGEIDVGGLKSPRAEGPEHSWPLPMAAAELGYTSTLEMLADNRAAIRILNISSGAEGAPVFANDTSVTVLDSNNKIFPFAMDPKETWFQMTGPRAGFFIIIIPFAEGDGLDKTVTLQVTDTVSEPTWDPPRPWAYDPIKVIVRNGFATEVRAHPSID